MSKAITKTQLKEAKERYFAKSKMIRELTYEAIQKETADEQEARIKRLLKPENYGEFFDYYFGLDSGLPLVMLKHLSFILTTIFACTRIHLYANLERSSEERASLYNPM